MISDFDVDLLVAAAHPVVVVEARKRVSNFKDFIEFSVGNKLHNLIHLDLNAGRKTSRLGLRAVVEKATIKTKPKAPHPTQIPLHQLSVVSVTSVVRIIQPKHMWHSGALKHIMKLAGLCGSGQNSYRFREIHLEGKKHN